MLEECQLIDDETTPEWITGSRAAANSFNFPKSSVDDLVRSGEVKACLTDPSTAPSWDNPHLINRKSLEEALIKRGRHPDPWPDPSVPEIVKPVPVLYSTDHLRSDQIGNVGEHLVAYYLSFAGASVSLVDRRGMDHFVRLPNGSMFALEVKTTSKPYKDERRVTATECRFTTRRMDADWFSFLDLSTNTVIFRRREDLSPKPKEAIPHRFFTSFYMNQSIQQLFDYYGAEPDPIIV